MAMEAAFEELRAKLSRLCDALDELRLAVEDKPHSHALADQLANSVDDALGWLEEARQVANDSQPQGGFPMDMDRARRVLTVSQERFNRVAQRFSVDLASYERMDELLGLGRGHGGEWLAWTSSIKEGLERCRPPMDAVSEALFVCWQEIAERVGMNSVSVQATNVGQQIKFDRKTAHGGKS